MVQALGGSKLGSDARLHVPAGADAHVHRATPRHAQQPSHLGGLVARVARVGQLAAAAQDGGDVALVLGILTPLLLPLLHLQARHVHAGMPSCVPAPRWEGLG